MTYPDRDDFLHAEYGRELEVARRDAAARTEFTRTGICTRRVEASDVVRTVCAVCLHAEVLHPGFVNPDPDLVGCLACHVKRTTGDQS